MVEIVEGKFEEWTAGKSPGTARISIYERIRDIPYAVIPELIDPENYINIFRFNKGSCTPKHFLLCSMYERLGLSMLFAVYPFKWDELEIDYPPSLKRLAKTVPLDHHLACKAEIEGHIVLVDATLDLALRKLCLPINEEWDGFSDTLLAVKPLDEELHHPSEAKLMKPLFDEKALPFYRELNAWLEELREGHSA